MLLLLDNRIKHIKRSRMMSINSKQHMINKILSLKEEEYHNVGINIYLVNKDKQKEEYYFSKSVGSGY